MTPEGGERPQAAAPEAAAALVVSEVKEIARQVKEELGKFQGEDLKLLSSEMRRDVEVEPIDVILRGLPQKQSRRKH
eukprot:g200.t1